MVTLVPGRYFSDSWVLLISTEDSVRCTLWWPSQLPFNRTPAVEKALQMLELHFTTAPIFLVANPEQQFVLEWGRCRSWGSRFFSSHNMTHCDLRWGQSLWCHLKRRWWPQSNVHICSHECGGHRKDLTPHYGTPVLRVWRQEQRMYAWTCWDLSWLLDNSVTLK